MKMSKMMMNSKVIRISLSVLLVVLANLCYAQNTDSVFFKYVSVENDLWTRDVQSYYIQDSMSNKKSYPIDMVNRRKSLACFKEEVDDLFVISANDEWVNLRSTDTVKLNGSILYNIVVREYDKNKVWKFSIYHDGNHGGGTIEYLYRRDAGLVAIKAGKGLLVNRSYDISQKEIKIFYEIME